MIFQQMPQCLETQIRNREGSKVQKVLLIYQFYRCYVAEGADIVSSRGICPHWNTLFMFLLNY